MLTDRLACARHGRSLSETVAAVATAGGPVAILLREKDLPRAERRALALRLRDILEPTGAPLLVASDVGMANEVGAGVHLAVPDRHPGASPALTGRSCHNEAELRGAMNEGCAYVTVSPVFTSASKPGYGPALGLSALDELCRIAGGLPAYALGGMDPGRACSCIRAGAHGVAVMGAVMGAVDPGLATAQLLGALPESSR